MPLPSRISTGVFSLIFVAGLSSADVALSASTSTRAYGSLRVQHVGSAPSYRRLRGRNYNLGVEALGVTGSYDTVMAILHMIADDRILHAAFRRRAALQRLMTNQVSIQHVRIGALTSRRVALTAGKRRIMVRALPSLRRSRRIGGLTAPTNSPARNSWAADRTEA
jgi:hypothetical protein